MMFWNESCASAYNFRLEYGIAKLLASHYRARLALPAVLRETHPFPGDGHIYRVYIYLVDWVAVVV